jgi:hypothetical protein
MARVIDMAAIMKCNLKGIFPMPFIMNIPINAVIRKDNSVIMPKYIINGFPKIKK